MSLVAPTAAERNSWGCHGRDIWVYMMNAVLTGATSLPGNHWSDSAEDYALTTDWLMGGGCLSSSDLVLARRFLAYMAKLVHTDSYGSSAGTANWNNPALFQSGSIWDYTGMRAMGNNYTDSKYLYLAAAGLTFDDNPTDDPALTNSCSATRYQVCQDGFRRIAACVFPAARGRLPVQGMGPHRRPERGVAGISGRLRKCPHAANLPQHLEQQHAVLWRRERRGVE